MNKAKRIIHKHAARRSFIDFIGSTIIALITTSATVFSLIWEFQSLIDITLSDIRSPYGGWGLLLIALPFGTIAISLEVLAELQLPQTFRHWRQTPERAAAYEHLATASVAELETRIHELEQNKATAESEISALCDEKSQLQKEYDAKLAALDKQIDSRQEALQKANYDSEIDLLKRLIRAQRGPRFFRRSTNIQ